MTTFRIQFLVNSAWTVYKTDIELGQFPIEFIDLSAAKTVARDLSGLETMPTDWRNWRIVDSHGNHHSLANS